MADQMNMGDEMPPGGASPPEAAPEAPADEGPRSIFLSKEDLGGKTMKVGDTITLTVKSVDPETGDCEGEIGGEPEGGQEPGYEAAFDKAMPEPGE